MLTLNANDMNKAQMLHALTGGFAITFEYAGSFTGVGKVVASIGEHLLMWWSVKTNEKGQIVVSIWPMGKTEH